MSNVAHRNARGGQCRETVKFPGGTLAVVVLSIPEVDPEARVQQDVPCGG
ncbi:MAG TPA: hypothetical protein VF815_41690 [Myxococcaceae bacterium]